MLRGEHNGRDRLGRIPLVGDRHLRLAVHTQPRHAPPQSVHLPAQPVRQHDGKRQVFGRLIRRVADHDPLIARAQFASLVDGGGDVRRLLVDTDFHLKQIARTAAHVGRIITDFVDGLHSDFAIRDLRFAGDFARDDDLARRGKDLDGDVRPRVLPQVRVQDAVGDLVTEFVGMSAPNAFGGYKFSHGFPSLSLWTGRFCTRRQSLTSPAGSAARPPSHRAFRPSPSPRWSARRGWRRISRRLSSFAPLCRVTG